MLESHNIEIHEERVKRKVWDIDDDYLTVETQLSVACWEDGIKEGDRVKVIVIKC